MTESIINSILNLFNFLTDIKFGKEILVFIISLLPVLELRGGLLAASLLGLKAIPSYIISIIGNVLPIPFILLLINKIIDRCKNSKHKKLNKFANYLTNKVDKNKESIEKYGFWGLVIFVGIPLPGTGAWTGSLIAGVLNMDRKKSFLAILLGVFMASIIMMIISFGLLKQII